MLVKSVIYRNKGAGANLNVNDNVNDNDDDVIVKPVNDVSQQTASPTPSPDILIIFYIF